MTQSANPAATPVVPANLACGFCKRPIENEFYRTLNRFACANCAGQVQGVIDKNVATLGFVIRAAIAGTAVSLACAIAWGITAFATNREFGILASVIGLIVAKTVVASAGKRRGRAYQILAAILSIVGIVLGKLIFVGLVLNRYYTTQGKQTSPVGVALSTVYVAVTRPQVVFQIFDVLWIGIAVYAAWRICQAPKISVVGPYPLPSGAATVMQFQTMEPAAPNAATTIAPPPPRQS